MPLTGFFKGLQAGTSLYNTVEDNSIKQAKERLALLQAEDDYANNQAIRGDVLRSKLADLQFKTMRDNANMDSIMQNHDTLVEARNAINKYTQAKNEHDLKGLNLYGDIKNQTEKQRLEGLGKKYHNSTDEYTLNDKVFHQTRPTQINTAITKFSTANENAQKNLNNAQANNIKSGLKLDVTQNRKNDFRDILNNAVTTGKINSQTGIINANKGAINAQTNLKKGIDEETIYEQIREMQNLGTATKTNNDYATQTLTSELDLESKTPQQQVEALTSFIANNKNSPLAPKASSMLLTAKQNLKDDTSTKLLQLGATKQAIATQYQLKELGNGMNEVIVNGEPVKLTDEQLVEFGTKIMPNKVMAEGMKIAKEYEQKLALKEYEAKARLKQSVTEAVAKYAIERELDFGDPKDFKKLQDYRKFLLNQETQQQGGTNASTEQRQFPSKEQISFDHNLKKVANELQQIGYIKIIGGQVYSNDGKPLTADDIKNIQAKRQEYFNKLGK